MLEVVAAVIRSDAGRFYIFQRPVAKARGLQWEFPGGKVEPGETKEQAIIRECEEELAVTLKIERELAVVEHTYPDVTIRLTLFQARISKGSLSLKEHIAAAAVTMEEAATYELCPADRELLSLLDW